MVVDREYYYIVVGMGLVTFLPRFFPVYFLSGRTLPGWFIEWLDLIPAAVLSALLLPELVTTGTPRLFMPYKLDMIVAIPTLLFALKTKSLGGTVVTGMGLYWLLDMIFR
jgi:branched-subunit amino acid transport protein